MYTISQLLQAVNAVALQAANQPLVIQDVPLLLLPTIPEADNEDEHDAQEAPDNRMG